MKIKRPSLAAALPLSKKREVSKAAAAQSQCHVKHYFIDFPAISRTCSLTWVDWGPTPALSPFGLSQLNLTALQPSLHLYHMITRCSGGRYMASPGLMPKAS